MTHTPIPHFDHLAEKLDQVLSNQGRIMKQIEAFAAKEKDDLSAINNSLNNIVAGITSLDSLIANFQASSGALSAADQQSLDEIETFSAALAAKAAAVSVAPPTPPATDLPTAPDGPPTEPPPTVVPAPLA